LIDRDLRLASDSIHVRKSSIAYFRVSVGREHLCRSKGVDIPAVLTIRIIYMFCSERTSSNLLFRYARLKNKKTSIDRRNIRYFNLKAIPLSRHIYRVILDRVIAVSVFLLTNSFSLKNHPRRIFSSGKVLHYVVNLIQKQYKTMGVKMG